MRTDAAILILAGTLAASTFAGDLDRRVSQSNGREWLAYEIDSQEESGRCCGQWKDDELVKTCTLSFPHESDERWGGVTRTDGDHGESYRMIVYLGIDDGELVSVQSYSDSCRPRPGRAPIREIDGITTDASARWLAEQIDEGVRGEMRDQILASVAGHAGRVSDRALIGWAEQDRDHQLAEQSIFWIGASQRDGAYRTLTEIMETDRSMRLREQAIFSIGLLDEPQSLDGLIEIARDNDERELRSQALFWLSQRAGERASETIQRAIRDDPDREVREQAVFAVSQLPQSESVPILMRLVRNNDDPDVREKAAFWLGQIDSPEVVDFFESILRGDNVVR